VRVAPPPRVLSTGDESKLFSPAPSPRIPGFEGQDISVLGHKGKGIAKLPRGLHIRPLWGGWF